MPGNGPFPQRITLRDSVNLVLNNLEEGNTDTKLVMRNLRELKVTTVSVLLKRRNSLQARYVAGSTNKEKRKHGDPFAIYIDLILKCGDPAEVDLADSTGWQWVDKGPWSGFDISVSSFYKRLCPIDSASYELSKKWKRFEEEVVWQKRWTLLWSSILTNRDKLFWWRVLHQGFYTCKRAAVLGHGDGVCQPCQLSVETIDHIFLHCPKIRPIWSQASPFIVSVPAINSAEAQVIDLLDQVFCISEEKAAQCVVVTEILRAIWISRNYELYDRTIKNVNILMCIRLATEKQAAMYREQGTSQSTKNRLPAAVRLVQMMDPPDRTRLQQWILSEASRQHTSKGESEEALVSLNEAPS